MTVQLGSVMRPSHRDMNWAFIMAVASWSCWLRDRRKESISSMNMMHGCNLTAKLNTAAVNFWDSPYHLSVRMDKSRLMN